MTTAMESRQALRLITGAAKADFTGLLSTVLLSGSPKEQRLALLDNVPGIIDYYTDGSSALAADFYDDEREKASVARRFLAEPVVVDRSTKIARAIAWGTESLFGVPKADPVLVRLAPVIQLETARPYRDTIVTNRRRDPSAIGWHRVTSGGCKFCRMLASRGDVYMEATASFASHTNCHCTAAPVFKGQPATEVDVIRYVASKRTKSAAERKRINDYLAENFSDEV